MTNETKNKPTLPDLKGKPYGGAWSIHEADTKQFVKSQILYNTKTGWQPDTQEFLKDYSSWMQQDHNIQGIEAYKYLAFSNGTTEVFDKFYMRHNRRRLRLWKGEYFYHQIVARESYHAHFNWIDDGVINSNDVVVVSLPFSDTGNVPKDFYEIMEKCCYKKVPVLIDMAYINISKPININLDYECIETITTSLSKVFPVETHRIGIRMNRKDIDDSLNAYTNNSTPYLNTNSINLGHELIKNYKNDYIVNKYSEMQKKYCSELDVTPSNCVIFGVDEKNKYSEYNRGGESSRLCFSKIWDGRVDQG